jgi:hypothetical protein
VEPDEATAYLNRLPRAMVRNAMRIWDHEDAVLKVDPDHFEVLSLKTPSRRVRVHRRGDAWRCKSDKHNNQDQPCAHILVVLLFEGIVERPNTAATVWQKGKDGRDQAIESKAWQLVPIRAPQILAKLLRQGLPIISPEPPPGKGRPPAPTFAVLYQGVMRALLRQNLNATVGAMNTLDNRANNPYGPVSTATLSRFLSGKSADSDTILQKLLALETWPIRPYESVFHPDGTGLTEQRFSAYFDERYDKRKRAKKQADKAAAKDAAKQGEDGPRRHFWTYAEILWSYRYTMVAALYARQGPFGEAPWLLPLLDRTRLMLQVGELGGDKAYVAHYIFDYARRHGIDPQIKFKANANPLYSHGKKKAYKRAYERAQIDPEGYAAKANRRNNAETGNHALKAILGDQIFSKDARAQRNEILCMAIAYNLTRLVYLEVERGIEVDFEAGAHVLAAAPWESLEALHAKHRNGDKPRPEWV